MGFDLGLGEELELLRDSASRFAAAELAPAMRKAESEHAIAPEITKSARQTGFDRLAVPEGLGGSGLGCLARAVVNEELAAADAGAALACDPFGPAIYGLLSLPESKLGALVQSILNANSARCVWIDDRDARVEVGAETVSGEVAWVPSPRSDLTVIDTGNELLVVGGSIEAAGIHGAGVRASGASALSFSNAPILARVSGERPVAMARAQARLYVASLILGVMRQACQYSREYACEREAFGKPIAHHQALAFLITDMHAAVEGVRCLLHDAAWRLDEGEDATCEAAQAFVEAVEASRFVGPNAIQILGGHGFMQDHPVEKYMRDSRALGLLLGGIDAAREDAGRAICAGSTKLDLCTADADSEGV